MHLRHKSLGFKALRPRQIAAKRCKMDGTKTGFLATGASCCHHCCHHLFVIVRLGSLGSNGHRGHYYDLVATLWNQAEVIWLFVGCDTGQTGRSLLTLLIAHFSPQFTQFFSVQVWPSSLFRLGCSFWQGQPVCAHAAAKLSIRVICWAGSRRRPSKREIAAESRSLTVAIQ